LSPRGTDDHPQGPSFRELLDYYERIARIDPELDAYVLLTQELALMNEREDPRRAFQQQSVRYC